MNEPSSNTEIIIGLEDLRKTIENWRNVACVTIRNEVVKKGSIKASLVAQQANTIEIRAAKLTRKVERLIILRDQGLSKIVELHLPLNWTLTDLERIMIELGIVSEERPTGIDDGTGRRRPALEF